MVCCLDTPRLVSSGPRRKARLGKALASLATQPREAGRITSTGLSLSTLFRINRSISSVVRIQDVEPAPGGQGQIDQGPPFLDIADIEPADEDLLWVPAYVGRHFHPSNCYGTVTESLVSRLAAGS